jgi:membrane protein implicated in regulation of membrane protease activity
MSEEFKSFLGQMLTSWQVVATTIVVILYIMLVSYVARFRQNRKGKTKPKRKKTSQPKQTENAQKEAAK